MHFAIPTVLDTYKCEIEINVRCNDDELCNHFIFYAFIDRQQLNASRKNCSLDKVLVYLFEMQYIENRKILIKQLNQSLI